ncbi:MAG: amidohydrolase, partial [bacterium]
MALAAALALALVSAAAAPGPATAEEPQPYPIFDAHLHFSAPAAAAYPVARVLAKLRRAGVARALVSSSPDAGSLALRAAAPQTFLPFSRPYRKGVGPANWTEDGATPAYVAGQLAKGVFGGIGEFHLDTVAAARRPTVRALARMAAERGLALQVHGGSEPVAELFAQQPSVRIVWAHVGFESDLAEVARMLGRYPRLLAETSFRAAEIIGPGGKLTPEWRRLLLAFSNRFMIGADT